MKRMGILSLLPYEVGLAFRSVHRSGAFFWLAVLTLGTGVGATTAIYSTLRSVVLEPLPYPGGERVVSVWQTIGGSGRLTPTTEQIGMLGADTNLFEAVATLSSSRVTVTDLGDAVAVDAVRIDSAVSTFMGVRPIRGRLFAPEELSGEGDKVVLISERFWRGRFAEDPDIVGQTITIDGDGYTVIGLMPDRAARPDGMPGPLDLWLPLGEAMPGRLPIARLRQGITHETATERVDQLFREMGAEGGLVTPATLFRYRGLLEPLQLLMVAVTLLLLVACVNVANLLLNRGARRARDTSVRAALGAGRVRLVWQFVLESLVLAFWGGAVGAAIAWAGVSLVRVLRPDDFIALSAIVVDGRILLFAWSISMAAGLAFGVMPAFYAARSGATSMLPRASRPTGGSASFRWSLVAMEVALSFALLTVAVILLANLRDSQRRDPGYDPRAFVAVSATLPSWRYSEVATRRQAVSQIISEFERLGDVERVAIATGVPPNLRLGPAQIELADEFGSSGRFMFLHGGGIDSSFFRVIGQSIVSGRAFTDDDLRAPSDAVILSESTAALFFGEGEALGRNLRISGEDHVVVGLVEDIAALGLAESEAVPTLYYPLSDVPRSLDFVLRTTRQDRGQLEFLANVVRRIEPDALVTVGRGADLLGDSLARQQFTSMLMSVLAFLAVLLAAVGLYGVLAQIVTTRTHEIGVRVALGATTRSIRLLVMRSGALAVIVGLLGGTVMAMIGLRVFGATLFSIEHQSASAYFVAAAVFGGASMMAMWLPSGRAAQLDPMRALTRE